MKGSAEQQKLLKSVSQSRLNARGARTRVNSGSVDRVNSESVNGAYCAQQSWVELNSGGGLAAENEYIRLLREAQRESRDSSVRHSRASSVKGRDWRFKHPVNARGPPSATSSIEVLEQQLTGPASQQGYNHYATVTCSLNVCRTRRKTLEYEHVNFKANENGVENTEKFAAELNLPQNLENIQNHENNHDSANSEIAEDKSSIANVIKHNATENTYICDQCGKVFTEKPKLIDHIATHNIIKGITKINLIRTCKFSCLSCDGLFATKSDLINHDIKVHDSKVNYKACEKCDFKAIKNSDLIRHVRTHSDQKPYQCTVCDSKFSASYPLKVHMRIHSGEKPYSCTVCDLKFSASHPLKLHMRIHSGEKPYSCTVCDSKFSKSYPLKLHMRIHSGEKPYSCTVCDSK
ncbi:hypothetical protein MSG28_016183, partial [Choristoneura fumiferana]